MPCDSPSTRSFCSSEYENRTCFRSLIIARDFSFGRPSVSQLKELGKNILGRIKAEADGTGEPDEEEDEAGGEGDDDAEDDPDEEEQIGRRAYMHRERTNMSLLSHE